jgi:hypothetical protein
MSFSLALVWFSTSVKGARPAPPISEKPTVTVEYDETEYWDTYNNCKDEPTEFIMRDKKRGEIYCLISRETLMIDRIEHDLGNSPIARSDDEDLARFVASASTSNLNMNGVKVTHFIPSSDGSKFLLVLPDNDAGGAVLPPFQKRDWPGQRYDHTPEGLCKYSRDCKQTIK